MQSNLLQADQTVTIRSATADDEAALRRLAALDSQAVPDGRLLVAEIAGEAWAAVQVDGDRAIADPFRRTAPLVELLAQRAAQLRGAAAHPRTSRTRRLTAPADSIRA